METVIFTPTYYYKLISTGKSSHSFGHCEVCKKHASEVFHQIEERTYIRHTGEIGKTFAGCHDLFGHKSCLLKQRKG